MKIELEAGKYVLAVSGGVDSIVLLDLLAGREDLELIVAHFDHGVREDSAGDAAFVESLAATYKLPYVAKREELGRGVSEEVARERRYAFLRSVAGQNNALIVTAHHADDAVETIAINLLRGTGWRGLAVLDSPDIVRPLLTYRKSELLTYAADHGLVWHEDSTNQEDVYLRNRVRRQIARSLDEDTVYQLLALRQHQIAVKREIDQEVAAHILTIPYSRYFFASIDDRVALELLRAVFVKDTGASPTMPQRLRALVAIKVAKPGTTHDVGARVKLRFGKRDFTVVDG